jgi:hypothetical protein
MVAKVPAPRPISPLHGQQDRKKIFDIMELAADIFMLLIKDHLTLFDRAAMALV